MQWSSSSSVPLSSAYNPQIAGHRGQFLGERWYVKVRDRQERIGLDKNRLHGLLSLATMGTDNQGGSDFIKSIKYS